MAEFCNCGSIVINGKCTNKNCDTKATKAKTSTSKKEKKAQVSTPKSGTRSPRRSSKCVTYKLSDFLATETPELSTSNSDSGDYYSEEDE